MLHWFPGHMHKATKEFRKKMPSIDIAIEIVDARIPDSSSNHVLQKIVGDKPIIKVLSKVDLADSKITQEWLDYYKGSAIAVNTLLDKTLAKKLIALAQKKLPNRGTVLKPIRAIIFGIPNVGKSTMINKLAGRKVAKTGNEPAITKLQQRIDVQKGFTVYDTPGIMFPSPKSEASGFRIASIGSIRDTAMDYEGTADYLIESLMKHNPNLLTKRYGLSSMKIKEQMPQEVLRDIAGLKNKHNITHAAQKVVHDFRGGIFGKFSLEDPKTIKNERLALKMKIESENVEQKD